VYKNRRSIYTYLEVPQGTGISTCKDRSKEKNGVRHRSVQYSEHIYEIRVIDEGVCLVYMNDHHPASIGALFEFHDNLQHFLDIDGGSTQGILFNKSGILQKLS